MNNDTAKYTLPNGLKIEFDFNVDYIALNGKISTGYFQRLCGFDEAIIESYDSSKNECINVRDIVKVNGSRSSDIAKFNAKYLNNKKKRYGNAKMRKYLKHSANNP